MEQEGPWWVERLFRERAPVRPGSLAAYLLAVGLAYLLAVGLMLLATLLRLLLDPVLVGVQFITFFPAIVIAALVGGLGPGILAAVLGFLAAWFLFFEPTLSFSLVGFATAASLVAYLLVAFAFCGLVHGLRHILQRLEHERERQRELNATLERRVAERTAELATANAELAATAERLRAEIAERERAEAQLRQAQKMEVVGQLTGGIAHDFNNLLTVIIGQLDRVRGESGSLPLPLRGRIETALLAAERAAALTGRLLAFARRQPLAPRVLDVNRLVAGMSELLRRTLGEQVALEAILAGSLWRVEADPGQLESALMNLAINARDAVPNGGKLTIETANARLDEAYAAAHTEVTSGQYVMIAVSDTGVGMPPEVVERAFEPFFTTKEASQGTGLGLSQVYGFVKQSGGHVKIYSEPGAGTTVKIYLRRSLSAETDALPPRTVEQTASAERRHRVLVVEDDELVRMFVVGCLQDAGCDVLEARDGHEALDILDKTPDLDLLLTDIGLPRGMTGRQLTEQARTRRPDLKVLFTTGYAPNAIVHHGVLDPGVALLSKPFTSDLLARKLQEVLAAPTTKAG